MRSACSQRPARSSSRNSPSHRTARRKRPKRCSTRYSVSPSRPTEVAAIIAAAGSGDRAAPAGGPAKQFRELCGKPVFQWSLEVFRRAGCSAIVVVVPPGTADGDIGRMGPGVVVTEGGATRQDSVRLGLDEVATEFVLVHDAARPLVSPALVDAVLDALAENDAVVPGVPVVETLKTSDGRVVTGTVDRSEMWTIQTPQGFRTSVLRQAHEEAARSEFGATDDAGLVERIGKAVTLVPGQGSNIKLTYPEDFDLARAVIEGRG